MTTRTLPATTWTVRRKATPRKADRFQVNGRGPWRSEYKTDCVIRGTLESEIALALLDDRGNPIGTWNQYWCGHEIVPSEGG